LRIAARAEASETTGQLPKAIDVSERQARQLRSAGADPQAAGTRKEISMVVQKFSHCVAGALFAAGLAGAASAGDGYAARSGGPGEAAMIARSGASPADGLAFVRPVLSGVLYRAGFEGGDKERTGLSLAQKTALCDAGFSGALYVDFGKHASYGETACDAGRFAYAPAKSTRPAEAMRAIHGVAVDPGRGPLLVHCMWGVHSSGAISAMALVQFCGWSEDRAKAYWEASRNDAPCSDGCDAWIDHHFDTFEFDPALTLTKAQRAAICPE
jgi:hypothetical protein